MRIWKPAPYVCLVALVALGGCGGGGPTMAEVEGTVTLNGKPLNEMQVEFWPESDGPRSMGLTDAQGRYTLTSDNGKLKGASVGAHRVLLKDVGIFGGAKGGRAVENVDLAKGKKPRVRDHYGDPQKTPLKKTVASGKNEINLEVTP